MQQQGRAEVKAENLRPAAWRVKELCENFKWISWTHVRRKWNTMADFTANEAMNTKARTIITANSSGKDYERYTALKDKLNNDITKSEALEERPNARRQLITTRTY